jgi:hypothetical protein
MVAIKLDNPIYVIFSAGGAVAAMILLVAEGVRAESRAQRRGRASKVPGQVQQYSSMLPQDQLGRCRETLQAKFLFPSRIFST